MGDVGDGLFEKFLGFMFRFVLRIEGHGQLVSPGEDPIEGARLVSGKPDAEVSGSEFGEDMLPPGYRATASPRKMEEGGGQQDGSQQHSADTKGQEPGRALTVEAVSQMGVSLECPILVRKLRPLFVTSVFLKAVARAVRGTPCSVKEEAMAASRCAMASPSSCVCTQPPRNARKA